MEGLSMDMGSLQTGMGTNALKGSLSTQKSAVATLMSGANLATANMPQEGDTARASMMQAQGVGQKIDITA